MFSIRSLYANMSSAYASDTSRSLSKEPQKACAVKHNRLGAYERVRESSHVFLGVFFTVGKVCT